MNCILSKILFCVFLPFVIIGQNDILNHEKYWYYKTRLNNDFIKIGRNPGESVPFNQRGSTQKGYPTLTQSANKLKTGDAISSIGYHIATLATEYALLKNNFQNTDSVKHELFCALNAINRIDVFAEPLWGWTGNANAQLNGFLVRDDVDKNFHLKNYEHFNYYNNGVYFDSNTGSYWPALSNGANDRGFCSQMLTGQTQIESDYSNLQKALVPSPDDITMSQDHYISLLVGLALVNKLVDYSANDNGEVFPYDPSNVTSLKQEAWNITDRIANHFKNNALWNYINPVTNQLVQPGGFTGFTQYGLAEASCKSEGFSAYPPDPFIPIANPFVSLYPYTCNYTTPYVRSIGFAGWATFLGTPPTSVDNQAFKVLLLATGHCGWQPTMINLASVACNWVTTNICSSAPWPINLICSAVVSFMCNTIYIPTPGYTNKTQNLIDFHTLQLYAVTEQNKENVPRKYDFWHTSLLHKVLFPNYNTVYGFYLSPIKGALDNAPCEGPYNFGQNARPQFEWTCENRLEKVINRQDKNEPDGGWLAYLDANITNPTLKSHTKNIFKGEYNGIDYMVMHNLYRLTASGISSSYYQNLSHRYINITLPVNPTACVKPNNCLFRAFETITADNTINSNGDVDYKAGKAIVLKPGFNTISGANFHAYIQASNCNNGSSGLRFFNGDSTNTPLNTFAGYDDGTGDDILTHYVDYSDMKDSVRENLLSSMLPDAADEIKQTPFVNSSDVIVGDGSFNVYPNPAYDFTTIEFSLRENETAQMTIYNNTGQIMAIDYVTDLKLYRKTILTGDLSKGLYLIKVVTDNNRILIKKLTVQ